MNPLEESVMDFVAGFTGVQRQRLTPGMTLVGDLGVDGDDGWDLIEAFGKEFRVDLSAFQFDCHFGSECLPVYAPLLWLWWLIRCPFCKKQTPEVRAALQDIQISDLLAMAMEKKWTL